MTDSRLSSKLLTSISLRTEPWLEKWARLFRFQAITPTVKAYLEEHVGIIRIVDYGCGQDVLYKKYLDLKLPQYKSRIEYVGIDPLIHEKQHDLIGHAEIIRSKFERIKLPKKADIVVMLAVLEHVDDATVLLHSAMKLIKPGGMIVGTTPSPLSKYPLEFFSYGLGIISVREIAEHKRYPTKVTLEHDSKIAAKRLKKSIQFTHRYFEFGLNNYFEVRST